MIFLKKINLFILLFVLVLFGYYIYQTVSISSGNVGLASLKKEFLERKNNLNGVASPHTKRGQAYGQLNKVSPRYGVGASRADNPENFEPDLIKEAFKMAEIERFDYIIIGPSEFALIQENSANSQ